MAGHRCLWPLSINFAAIAVLAHHHPCHRGRFSMLRKRVNDSEVPDACAGFSDVSTTIFRKISLTSIHYRSFAQITGFIANWQWLHPDDQSTNCKVEIQVKSESTWQHLFCLTAVNKTTSKLVLFYPAVRHEHIRCIIFNNEGSSCCPMAVTVISAATFDINMCLPG